MWVGAQLSNMHHQSAGYIGASAALGRTPDFCAFGATCMVCTLSLQVINLLSSLVHTVIKKGPSTSILSTYNVICVTNVNSHTFSLIILLHFNFSVLCQYKPKKGVVAREQG